MKIQYSQNSGSLIWTDDEGIIKYIPLDPKNKDYHDIHTKHVATGYQILPCDPLPDTTKRQIKDEATKRIYNITPGDTTFDKDKKQLNYTAQGTYLERKDRLQGLNAEEQTMLNFLLTFWGKIDAIRKHSNYLETDYENGEQINILSGISSSHPNGWPY